MVSPSLRWLIVAAAGLVLVLTSADAEAKRKKKKKTTIALFPFLEKDGPDTEIVAAVSELTGKASLLIKEVKIISGKKLKKKVKKDPGKAIAKCGSDLKCIAKLGKKAKAKEVILARASPADGGGINVLFLTIDVKSKGVARNISLSFASVADVKVVLGGAFYELFGMTDPGFLVVSGGAGQVRVDGEVVGVGDGRYELSPGRHEVSVGGVTESVMIAPGADKEMNLEELGGAALALEDPGDEGDAGAVEFEMGGDAGGAEEEEDLLAFDAEGDTAGAAEEEEDLLALEAVAESEAGSGTVDEAPGEELALAPPVSEATATPPIDDGPTPWLLYSGIAVGGVGVVLLGVGAIFGGQASSLSKQKAGATQVELLAQQQDQNDAASVATGMMVAGGVVAGLGAAAIMLDLFVLGEDEATLSVGVTPEAGQATLTIPF